MMNRTLKSSYNEEKQATQPNKSLSEKIGNKYSLFNMIDFLLKKKFFNFLTFMHNYLIDLLYLWTNIKNRTEVEVGVDRKVRINEDKGKKRNIRTVREIDNVARGIERSTTLPLPLRVEKIQIVVVQITIEMINNNKTKITKQDIK